MVDSAGIRAAQDEIVLGSNWTLRALVPSIWHVVDLDVWKSERGFLSGCPDSLVVVASKHIFGGGPYSIVGSHQLKTIGQKKWPVAEITIGAAGAALRRPNGQIVRPTPKPFMPETIRHPYHPGGNSVCFMVQTAHLMGCNPIYLLGFTMMSGTGYFFSLENPATKKRSFYSDPDRALSWLSWYQKQFPGRLKLWPGWSGPIYNAVEVLDEQEAQELSERKPQPRYEREAHREHGEEVQRLRPERSDQSVHRDGVQSRPKKRSVPLQQKPRGGVN